MQLPDLLGFRARREDRRESAAIAAYAQEMLRGSLTDFYPRHPTAREAAIAHVERAAFNAGFDNPELADPIRRFADHMLSNLA